MKNILRIHGEGNLGKAYLSATYKDKTYFLRSVRIGLHSEDENPAPIELRFNLEEESEENPLDYIIMTEGIDGKYSVMGVKNIGKSSNAVKAYYLGSDLEIILDDSAKYTIEKVKKYMINRLIERDCFMIGGFSRN